MRLFGGGRPSLFELGSRGNAFRDEGHWRISPQRTLLGLVVITCAMVVFTSCATSDSTVTPTQTADIVNTITITPAPTATAMVISPTGTQRPTSTSTPMVVGSPAPDMPATKAASTTPLAVPSLLVATPAAVTHQAELFIEIFSPATRSTVAEAELHVNGRSSPDATVSVNDQLASMNISGEFEATLQLLVGPNLIEVIASDLGGTVRSQLLVIVYLP